MCKQSIKDHPIIILTYQAYLNLLSHFKMEKLVLISKVIKMLKDIYQCAFIFFSLIHEKLTKMLQYTTCLNFYGFKLCFHTMCISLQLVHHISNLKVSLFTPTKKILTKNHIMLEHHNIVTILIIMLESLGISKWRLTSKTKAMICNSLKANKKWTWERKNSQIKDDDT